MASVLSMVLLYFGVTRLAAAYRRTGERLEEIRVEVVRNAARRTRELGAMSGRLAHELKNPLAAIKGLVQLNYDDASSEGERSARVKKRLGVVLEEVSRLERVLGEYLNFSKPLSDIEIRRGRLDSLLHALGELIEGEARSAGLSVRVRADARHAWFDEPALRRALLNLTQNALSAMPSGGTLEILGTVTGAGVRIELRDDGVGMQPEQLARIKEPFFSGRSGGTGLGVVIADRIIEQHAGSLEFESKPGEGTTVTVTLPSEGPRK
jgi:signal transduction histidine kinase